MFILWGSHARRKKALIDTSRHTVIESAHPSPLSAHNGFFGSKPFSRTNAALDGRRARPDRLAAVTASGCATGASVTEPAARARRGRLSWSRRSRSRRPAEVARRAADEDAVARRAGRPMPPSSHEANDPGVELDGRPARVARRARGRRGRTPARWRSGRAGRRQRAARRRPARPRCRRARRCWSRRPSTVTPRSTPPSMRAGLDRRTSCSRARGRTGTAARCRVRSYQR